jgi:hypothetical protein
MISTRPNKWILALWVLAGVLSASDLYLALKSAHGNLTHPNTEILTASSRLLLAVAFAIFMYTPQRRPIPIAVAVGALSLAIWGALEK